MQYVQLGRSGIEVSRLCLGCGPLGLHGYGDVDPKAAAAVVLAAVDLGINFFDTSDTYGLGRSEEQLGNIFAGNGKVVIATKFGVRVGSNGKSYYDNSPAWCKSALDASLKRLKRESVDIYFVHYWDQVTPLEIIFETLSDLRKAGKFKFAGISNMLVKQLAGFELPEWVICSQLEYSLLCLDHKADLDKMQNIGLSPMPYGCLAQGMLSGKYDQNTSFATNDRRGRSHYLNFHGEKLQTNLNLLQNFKSIAAEKKLSLVQLALGWVLQSLPSSSAIVAAKNVLQLNQIVDACSKPLEQQTVQMIKKIVGV